MLAYVAEPLSMQRGLCTICEHSSSTAQHSTAQHSTAQHSTAQPSPAQPSPAQRTTVSHTHAAHTYLSEANDLRGQNCRDILERSKRFARAKLEGHLGGVGVVGPPACNHQGFPLLVFQDFTLIQNLHTLLPNLSTSAVELVAIQYTQLQCTTKAWPLYIMFRLLRTSRSSRISIHCSPSSRHLLLNLLPSSIPKCSAQAVMTITHDVQASQDLSTSQ